MITEIPIYNSNLKQNCPDFLLQSKTIKNILEVEDKEHDRLRQLIDEVQKQCYIETATWGLNEWEKMADIQPNPNATIEQRRATILARLRFSTVSTREFLEQLIKKYCYENTSVRIEEDNPHNYFRIYLNDGDAWNIADLVKAVEDFKPAHLAYGWGIGITTDLYQTHESEATINIVTKHNYWNKGKSSPLHWDGAIDWDGYGKWNGILPGEGYADAQKHELKEYKLYPVHQYFANDKHIIDVVTKLNGTFRLDGQKDLSGLTHKLSDTIKHSIDITTKEAI